MIRVLILVCVALGVALIALLFRASSNNTFFEEHYAKLFWLGLALTAGLTALIGVQIHALYRKLRAREFGSKLGLRLMAVFALMAVIPGGLVYTISVQFLNRSIDSWFDVPVDRALESAIDLGRAAIESSSEEVVRRARDAALRAADSHADATEIAREVRRQYGFDEVAIVADSGMLYGWAGSAPKRLLDDKPGDTEIAQALNKGPFKAVETLGERGLYFRVVVTIPAAPSLGGVRVMQVMQPAPKRMMGDVQSVETGVRDYQRLQLLRGGLKRVFALTLTLAMVLTLFSALALSFVLSERLSAPLSALAESTRAIAKGDFSKLNPVKSRDEFGVLTQSFNTMTRQLAEASDVVVRKQHELETANAYLESILGNLTTGVVTLDERLVARSINRAAGAMLGIEQSALTERRLPEWAQVYPDLAAIVGELSAALTAGDGPRERAWEKQIAYSGTSGKRSLLVRGSKLPDAGYILVFDDITGLIQAQRDAAWGEVARRLAHEIKNPLTPIQLSAERLQRKLTDKLPDSERDILSKATQTIVAQVGALKSMVDDFSLYSRASRIVFAPVDLNALLDEVLTLYESGPVRVVQTLAPDLPAVRADAALLRQVIHNLMQNAQDALAGVDSPRIDVRTAHRADEAVLVIEDNGSGVREEVQPRIFEPYVTTKPKGTGLGLAIVKKIVDEHKGSVHIENVAPHGARVTIALPALTEPAADAARAAQWPATG